MNPFEKYAGLKLNGREVSRESMAKGASSDFEQNILDFACELFSPDEEITVHSSGSTSSPKPFTFPKKALEQSALATNIFFGLNRYSTALLALPVSYIAGKMMIVRAIVGQYNLLGVKPASNPLGGLLDKVDFAPFTPHQIRSIFHENPEKLENIGTLLLGGGPIDRETKKFVAELPCKTYLGFGMTETLTHFALAELKKDQEVIFEPLPDVKISRNERGCLVVDRPGITSGALITNDLVKLLPNGFQWLGRIDNLINSGGVKIVPEEVEAKLRPHLKSPFFIAGVPDPYLGEKSVLFVESSEKPNLRKVEFEEPYQEPKEIISLDEFLYTKSGKIKRRATVEKWLQEISDC